MARSHVARSDVDFLLGAGLSMKPPSRLPSGMQLKDLVVTLALERLGDRELVAELLDHSAFKAVQPEILFADIYTIAGKFVFAAIRHEITGALPNASHYALSQIVKAREATFYTTNFDDLLEAAGIDPAKVKHLHGSIDEPGSIGALISDVTRPALIKEPHSNRRLLIVAGYSGSDPDVLRFLRRSPYRAIIWLLRPGGDEAVEARVSRADLPMSVHYCLTDMHGFIDALASVRNDAHGARRKPRAYRPAPPGVDRAVLITAMLLYRCELYPKCVELIDQYLASVGPKSRSAITRAEIFRAEAGRPSRLSPEASLARLQPLGAGIPPMLRLELNNIRGVLNLDMAAHDQAKHHFERIIDHPAHEDGPMFHRDRATRMKSIVANNLGLAHHELGNFREARRYFLMSIRTKIRTGNPLGLVSGFHNLALVHTAEGRFERAKRWDDKARELAERHGAYRRRIEHLKDMHDLLLSKGLASEARSLLTEALQLFRDHVPHLTALGEELQARTA